MVAGQDSASDTLAASAALEFATLESEDVEDDPPQLVKMTAVSAMAIALDLNVCFLLMIGLSPLLIEYLRN